MDKTSKIILGTVLGAAIGASVGMLDMKLLDMKQFLKQALESKVQEQEVLDLTMERELVDLAFGC